MDAKTTCGLCREPAHVELNGQPYCYSCAGDATTKRRRTVTQQRLEDPRAQRERVR